MNKLTILFLTPLLVCLPLTMNADALKEKKDDTGYLAGAVPEVDGKVVFSKEFQIPGMTQAQVFDTAMKWMEKRLKENKNEESRVVYSNVNESTIAGVGEEWIVFSSSALSLDRTLINYQITIVAKPENCLVELEKIRYTYRDVEKYKAEEWITDKYALNKTKTKLVRGLAKWRRKTVDFANDLFIDVSVAFGAPDTRAKAQKKAEEKKTEIITSTGPVVIQPASAGAIGMTPSQTESTTVAPTPSKPAAKTSVGTQSYAEVDLKQIPGEVYALMGNSKIVISIGTDEFNMTNMTANAGGALGYQSGKAVAYCTLSPDQNYDVIEKTNNYTLKLYEPNQTTPSAIIECKKLSGQGAPQAGRTYIGEITKLSVKK